MSEPPTSGAWTIVIPVKVLASAKSRLALADDERIELAAAMARDTVAAAMSPSVVQSVVVVTGEQRLARELAELGADVVSDEPDDGLNAALRHGMEWAMGRGAVRLAAMLADLPAVRGDDIAGALAMVTTTAVVGDLLGTGTTLLAAVDGSALRPRFGDLSLSRHLADGAVDLSGSVSRRLRRDVDTVEDLADARVLGLGRETERALGRLARR